MRTSISLIILLILFACVDNKPKKNALVYYVVGSTGKIPPDTIRIIKNEQADTADYFITQDMFTYKKTNHIIKVYTSDNHAPVDGGHLYYTLDSLGIIYKRSTTWPGFGRLTSNNDSINDLINHTFAYIIQKPQLNCFTHRRVDTLSPPPIVGDK